ncbi:MAG: cupin domain-containing protein [Solirubrobacterales bacterium]
MAEGYEIKHTDEFEEMGGSGGATWRLARKSLGAEAFGFNVVDIAPGGEIPAHDHSGDDQEEVYAVLEGEGVFVVDGDEHPAPAGTYARLAPEVSRTIRNSSDAPIRCLVIGVPMKSGYEPMSWG